VNDKGISRAMDSFDFCYLLQGWGGLEYYPTNRSLKPLVLSFRRRALMGQANMDPHNVRGKDDYI
jgi:hypothetical protein